MGPRVLRAEAVRDEGVLGLRQSLVCSRVALQGGGRALHVNELSRHERNVFFATDAYVSLCALNK